MGTDEAGTLDAIKELQLSNKALTKTIETLRLEKHRSTLDHQIRQQQDPNRPIVFQADVESQLLLNLIDYGKNLSQNWIIGLGPASEQGTAIVCGCATQNLEDTQALAQALGAIAPLKAGTKPGLIRGVLGMAITAEMLEKRLESN
jgi:hypothetical protein